MTGRTIPSYKKEFVIQSVESILPVTEPDWQRATDYYRTLSGETFDRDPADFHHFFFADLDLLS